MQRPRAVFAARPGYQGFYRLLDQRFEERTVALMESLLLHQAASLVATAHVRLWGQGSGPFGGKLAHQFSDGAFCLIDGIVRPRVATGIGVGNRHTANGAPRFF